MRRAAVWSIKAAAEGAAYEDEDEDEDEDEGSFATKLPSMSV